MKILSEYQLRQEIVCLTRIVADQGLIRSSDGNISVRLDDEKFLVTPSGLYKMAMEPDDLLVVDWKGRIVSGKPGLKPTSELNMHLEIYRQRGDISAILHAHPPYATALTLAGIPFPTNFLPEVLIALGDVPTAPYATPGTQALADSFRTLIINHNAILLGNHGSITAGHTLEDALIGLERLEHAAYTFHLAYTLGGAIPLTDDELVQLRVIGNRFPAKT